MATEAISYLSDKKEIAALPSGARNDKKAVATQSASPALVPSRVFAGTTPGFLIALRFSEMTHGYVITFSVISRSIATRNLKCSMKVMKKSVDRRGETDYKFLPLSSSKSGFEHGIKKTWGEHHAERIRILSN